MIFILNSFENQAGGSVLWIPQSRKDFGWQSAFSGAPVASPMLFAGKLISGFVIGIFVTLSFTYIGEGTVSYSTLLLDQRIKLKFAANSSSATRCAYRSVFVAQYGVAAVGTLFMPFMPEVAWLLPRRYRKAHGYNSAYASSIIPKPTAQKWTVGKVMFFPKQLAGYSSSESFILQIIQQVISMIGNAISWFLVERVSRRPLIFSGLCSLTVYLILTDALEVVATPTALKGTCDLILVYCWGYNVTIGAIAYTLLAETATSRLRFKTLVIDIFAHNAINERARYSSILRIRLYSSIPTKPISVPKSLIFGGLAALACLYLWIYEPETAGRTYKELDEVFTSKVAGRKFKSTKTQTELEGVQAKDIQAEKTQGEHNV
ncbi:uncharacterized protein K444DRAFT_698014 [Hyaloscypha bicolor E]|uniref:MFS general substrate transporter n=1 Tax=Hyaloscypha bicolor E TaxID=1095630 RepID=A0A2J6TTK6_9HELO|nr:uncharacterized protein K444DRAFT_698014 [Hyaloscypha bicolor E]PMD66354.1 hypothetical protein K444DRAFT_698014 [Hyaloscypha bicolor E]